jgi:hypothetical protein
MMRRSVLEADPGIEFPAGTEIEIDHRKELVLLGVGPVEVSHAAE